MRELIAGFQASLLWICVVLLLSLAGIAACPIVRDALAKLRSIFCRSKVQGILAAVAIVGAVMYGGSKGTRSVSFPRTDIEVAYLVDAGIILSYWPDGSTNEDEIVTALAAPLADFPNPLDFAFENAISNRWYCYTTWTPGPAVHTNGVWQTIWMMDRRDNFYMIPIRTWIEADGEVIAPPVFTLPEEGEPDDE